MSRGPFMCITVKINCIVLIMNELSLLLWGKRAVLRGNNELMRGKVALIIVFWVLIRGSCLLLIVSCPLIIGSCLLIIDSCLLIIGSCLLIIDSCLLIIGSCLLIRGICGVIIWGFRAFLLGAWIENRSELGLVAAKRLCLFAATRFYSESSFEAAAIISSPDSSGSPLLCVGFGDAAATADSGTGHDTR